MFWPWLQLYFKHIQLPVFYESENDDLYFILRIKVIVLLSQLSSCWNFSLLCHFSLVHPTASTKDLYDVTNSRSLRSRSKVDERADGISPSFCLWHRSTFIFLVIKAECTRRVFHRKIIIFVFPDVFFFKKRSNTSGIPGRKMRRMVAVLVFSHGIAAAWRTDAVQT